MFNPFELYFEKIDGIGDDSLLYAQLNDEEKACAKNIAYVVFRYGSKLEPKNQQRRFSFRMPPKEGDEIIRAFFWFSKPQGKPFSFHYKKSPMDEYSASIPCSLLNLKSIRKTVMSLLETWFPPEITLSTRDKTEILEDNYPLEIHIEEHLQEKGGRNSSLNFDFPEEGKFFAGCNAKVKSIIKGFLIAAASLWPSLTPYNQTSLLCLHEDWETEEDRHYWIWFSKPSTDSVYINYRFPFQNSKTKVSKEIKAEDLGLIITDISSRISLKPKANINATILRVSNCLGITLSSQAEAKKSKPKDPDWIADLRLSDKNLYFSRFSKSEQKIILEICESIFKAIPDAPIANRKQYFGCKRTKGQDRSFSFEKRKKRAGRFIYRPNDGTGKKRWKKLMQKSSSEISLIIQGLLGNATVLKTPKHEKNHATDIWKRPYLYVDDLRIVYGDKIGVDTLRQLCAKNGFVFQEKNGVAFRKKYASLTDTIYRSEILDKKAEMYRYRNPYDSRTYDRAVQALMDEFRLFEFKNDEYLTELGLSSEFGITRAELIAFRRFLGKKLKKYFFFSKRFLLAECPTLSILSSPLFKNLFAQALLSATEGKKPIILVSDENNEDAIFCLEKDERNLAAFFLRILGEDRSLDIYEIKNRVLTYYGVKYDLDSIGRDATKAGYFYSEELEKVYRTKRDYQKEIEDYD